MSLSAAVMRRLEELADRHGLEDAAVRALGAILQLEAEDPTASTTVREPKLAVDRHVADSLAALNVDAVRAARRIVDIGAGAGWPGLALAAALPDARVTLLESAARHCRYLGRAADVGRLKNVTVVNARAEAWPDGIGRHDLATARALAALPVVCEYAAPLLAPGGTLVAWKGALDEREAADGAVAAAELGLDSVEVRRTEPYTGAREHTLHIYRKSRPTPDRFPRRPGIATKRPLSAK